MKTIAYLALLLAVTLPVLAFEYTDPITTGDDWTVVNVGQLRDALAVVIPAGAAEVDGVQCIFPTAGVLDTGRPFIRAITCAENAAGTIYFDFPANALGAFATFTVTLYGLTVDATVSGGNDDTIGFDVSCQSRGDGDTLGATWGSTQDLDITFVTQYVEENVTSSAITPNGVVVAGDTIYCRAVVNISRTDTTTTDFRLTRLRVQ